MEALANRKVGEREEMAGGTSALPIRPERRFPGVRCGNTVNTVRLTVRNASLGFRRIEEARESKRK
eukprot:scaffold2708_cov100-Isochrysis_galbana.AAC.5